MKKFFIFLLILILSVSAVFAEEAEEKLFIDIAVKNNDFGDNTTTDTNIVGEILLSQVASTNFMPYATEKGIVMTESKDQATGAFVNQKLNISSSFAIAFSMELYGVETNWGAMADGFMFIVSKDTKAIGLSGGGLGYQGVENSFALEFDDYYNEEAGDTSRSVHTDFRTNGNMNGETGYMKSLGISNSSFYDIIYMNSSTVYTWVEYDAENKVLEARYAFDTTVRPKNPSIRVENINVKDLIKDDYCYLGFTASTGGAWQKQTLSCLLFDSTSCEPLDFNKGYKGILLGSCKHTSVTNYERLEPTCTDGHIAYKYCNDCHMITDLNGNILSESDVVLERLPHLWNFSLDGENILASCERETCQYHENSVALKFASHSSFKFEYEVVPKDATSSIDVYSLNPSVVSLSPNGYLQANGIGTTKIKVSSNDIASVENEMVVTVI